MRLCAAVVLVSAVSSAAVTGSAFSGFEWNLTFQSGSKLTTEEILEVQTKGAPAGSPEAGRPIFEKVCAACHRFGESIGKDVGPDLTTIASRFTKQDVLESILWPSKVISDQYTAVNVDMRDGDTLSGMLIGESETQLTLISATGERMEIGKDKVKDQRPSKVSIMPEGLLGTMNLGDLVNLILFLEQGAS